MNPASKIGHLRVVGAGADELGRAELSSGCNSVTKPPETAAERVRQMLEGALQGWQNDPSVQGLRRRLYRLLLELDEGTE